MGAGNFKNIITAVTTAFSALIYTKKRLRKENKLRAIHSKESNARNELH
jgi:hypothetical protein